MLPNLIHLSQKRIFITIYGNSFYILEMSGSLALYPLALSASAVIGHPSGFDSILKSLLIHIRHHQYFIGLVILDDNRDQTVRIQLEFGEIHQAFKRSHLDSLLRTDLFKCAENPSPVG